MRSGWLKKKICCGPTKNCTASPYSAATPREERDRVALQNAQVAEGDAAAWAGREVGVAIGIVMLMVRLDGQRLSIPYEVGEVWILVTSSSPKLWTVLALPTVRPFSVTPALVKTQRARELLAQLNPLQKEIASPEYLGTDVQRDGRDVVVRLSVKGSPPSRIGCIVGDVVHNLRTALDYLAWLAVEWNGCAPTKKTQFPVCSTNATFSNVVSTQLGGAPKRFVQFVESLQPFNSQTPSESALGIVHRLDINDKHNRLLVSALMSSRVSLEFDEPGCLEREPILTIPPFPLVDGAELARFRLALGREVVRPPFKIGLGADLALIDESLINGRPLTLTLYQLIKQVETDVLFPTERLLNGAAS